MMDYYSVGIFFIQGTLVALLILVLFRFRKTLGIGILFACLGLFQFMQVFLSSTVYVKIAENMLVSPGSAVLFTASLFAVLIIYIKEDAAETRKIIYALLAVNLIMSVLLWLVSLLVRNSPDFNPLNVSTVVFSNNAWVLLIGTSALLIDTLLIIFLYELISRFVRYLYLRMIFSMTIVVCFDAIFFTLLALHGYDNYYSILYSGIVSKTVFVLYYSIFFSVYLKCFEKHSSEMVNVKFRDVFQTFSFRQKYEQVTKEVEKASKEIQLREDRYKILTDISPVGIFHADSNGATTYVNQRWCEMSGVKVDEAFGFGWLKAVHPDDVDRISGGWDEAVEKKRNSKTEYRFLRSDGTICWVLGNATAQMDESNNILGYVGTITDITKLKLFEQEQVRLREKAEESNKLKSAFLANVSHEIRTPMNGILGFADLIASDDITNSERKDYIEIIIQSGQRMLNIINDIISISRIEAGLVDIKMDHVNVNEIIDFVYTFFKPEA
ncbi:MAG TPA: histidine kinase dimerization/phospho-acceptor domain-containing protein, partial [Bacteroidales bacterium]|nr:histidine kinase dimerization/phospho-acceptor domain-containing protein [Bacteroidales bacterium]